MYFLSALHLFMYVLKYVLVPFGKVARLYISYLSSCSSVKLLTNTCIFSLSSASTSSFDFLFNFSPELEEVFGCRLLCSDGIANNSLAKFLLVSSNSFDLLPKEQENVHICIIPLHCIKYSIIIKSYSSLHRHHLQLILALVA